MKNVRSFSLFVVALVAFASPAHARTAEPGPAAFARFLGTWSGRGATFDTKFSKAGAVEGHTVCRYSQDQLFLICEQTATVGGEPMHDVAVYSYDPNRKRYRFQSVAPAFVNVTQLRIEGNVWTYEGEGTVDGKTMRYRTVNEFPDATTEQYHSQASDDGGKTWTTTGSGTVKRVSP